MTTEPDLTEPRPDPTPAPPASEPKSRMPWVIAAVVLVAVVLLGRPILRSILPAPRLGPALKLFNEGRFAEAEAKLADLVAYDPANPQTRLFLARAMLDREGPKPSEAIETLKALRPATPLQAAEGHVLRGMAHEALGRPDQAELAWKQALEIDPLVGEAGWLLLQLHYSESREEEARKLALQLSKIEPHPGDRVRLLLEPIRYEAEPLAAAGVISQLASAVKANPDDRNAALAYYRAMATDGTGVDEAVTALQALVKKSPEDLASQDALLFALDTTGDLDGMAKALDAIPTALAAEPKIAGHRGSLALKRKDYAAAIPDLEKAVKARPWDIKVLHLLADAYRFAGKTSEAEVARAREAGLEAARIDLRAIKGKEQEEGRPGLFEEASSRRDLGLVPNPELYKRLAANREAMGHPDEALAWHQLILRDSPDDSESLEALKRLGGAGS